MTALGFALAVSREVLSERKLLSYQFFIQTKAGIRDNNGRRARWREEVGPE